VSTLAEQVLDLQAVQNKELISSDLSKVFEKLVKKPRGGYCFEQNTLFATVLRSLGYGVITAAARHSIGAFFDIHCLLPQARKEWFKKPCFVYSSDYQCVTLCSCVTTHKQLLHAVCYRSSQAVCVMQCTCCTV